MYITRTIARDLRFEQDGALESHPIPGLPAELAYLALLFALFVAPKWLQRYRIPAAITSLTMGVAATLAGMFGHDPTIQLLATFGIVALFLFAGLEIDGGELRRNAAAVIVHGLIWLLVASVTTGFVQWAFDLRLRPAILVALALVTPSTGFILSSLSAFGLEADERFAVKSKAVAAELLSLGALFFALQSTSVVRLGMASLAMLAIVLLIPLAFRLFAANVAPHAPRSEFAFLLMVALVCSYATRRLGVYYLVGAFVVGVAAQRFRARMPAMSSEKMVDALEAFGSVFIPFYFFNAGSHVDRRELGPAAIALGLAFVATFVPIRIAVTIAHRRLMLGDPFEKAKRISVSLVPTLVFSLVIAEILRDRFDAPDMLVGALVVYTVINTTIPAFVLHVAPPEFENVSASSLPDAQEGAAASPPAAPPSAGVTPVTGGTEPAAAPGSGEIA